MSLEKALEENTAAMKELTLALTRAAPETAAPSAGKSESAAKGSKKSTAQVNDEHNSSSISKDDLQAAFKKFAAAKGKDAAIGLLADFQVTKFSGLHAKQYQEFQDKLDSLMESDTSDAGEKTKEKTEGGGETDLTLDDIKPLIVKITNSKELGRDVARNILDDHDISKLSEMKKEDFAPVKAAAEKALKEAGIA